MGQKVHPVGFRLGVYRNWDSRWFARKEYGDFVLEDYNIRKFLKKRAFQAGVARIEIERAANKVRIRMHTARPGIIIGKKGAEIEKLKNRTKANQLESVDQIDLDNAIKERLKDLGYM